MPLASDLMGYGMPPNLAGVMALGGLGPVTITALGSSFATAARIPKGQYLSSVTNANSTLAVALPVPSHLGDQYIVGNTGSGGTLPVFASSGVSISVSGTNTSATSISTFTSMIFYSISSTQWIANRSA